jgi:hypothetical protein
MEKILFDKLAKSKKDLENLLAKFDLELQKNSWLHEAYSMVEKITNVWNSGNLRKKFLQENDPSKIFDSLHDVLFLYDSFSFIKEQDSKLLKKKFKKILKVPSLCFENYNNNEARNVLWEISLCSLLNKSGIKAFLKDPNPDILVSFNNSRNYCFECKRVFSKKETAIKSNVNKAAKQLRKNSSTGEKIIALSLEKCMLPNSLDILIKDRVVDSEKAAMNKLKNILKPIINEQKKSINENSQMSGVFLYIRDFFLVGEKKIFSPVSFFSIIDNSRGQKLSDDFKELFAKKDN